MTRRSILDPNTPEKPVAEFAGGEWILLRQPKNPDHPNFVICCPYGDWSGFRSLPDCMAQVMSSLRPDYFFWIEER